MDTVTMFVPREIIREWRNGDAHITVRSPVTVEWGCPYHCDPTIFSWFVPSVRIFLAEAVYMVLGSSYYSLSLFLIPLN